MKRKFTEIRIGKHHIHYAWVVLFACCMFFGASMGIYSNCSGLYTAGMLGEMGWSLTLITVVGVGNTIARLYGSRIAPRLFKKYSMKTVIAVAEAVLLIAGMSKSLVKDLAFYALFLVVDGLAGAFIYYIPVPILINNWFHKKKDTALGIAMMSSGLMGAIASPLFGKILETSGWRTANAVNCFTALLVSLPAILLFVEVTPEKMGLKPYGWEPPEPVKVITSPSRVFENGSEDYETGVSVKKKRSLFLLSMILAMLMNGVSGMPPKIPHFAITAGFGATLGSLMLSASQVGNMASKAALGPLCDRFGHRRTYTVSAVLVFVSFLIFLAVPSAEASQGASAGTLMAGAAVPLLLASFLTGISAANNTMIYPASVRLYSRGDEYVEYISRISMAITVFGAVWNLLQSALFDLSGNYTTTFLLYTVASGIAAVLTVRLFAAEKTGRK